MSALCQKRPNALQQKRWLFDHLVGEREQRRGNVSMSNALAVCRLMTSSNLIPRRIGKSAGFFRLQGCGQHAGPRPLSSTQAELQDEYLGYCGAMLAIRTTLPHFSDSAAMKAANSWALSGIGTVPRSASRASIV